MHGVSTKFVVIYTTNVFSTVASLSVLISYALFKRKYPVAMSRSTLVISACMAISDLFEHAFNLVGYMPWKPAACPVVGGFFFATPLLCTVFYACSVSLNCLFVFVFRVRQTAWLKWLYLLGPPIASIAIGLGTLMSGSYGWDDTNNLCWFKTEGVSEQLLGLRQLLTFGVPMMAGIIFLLVSIPVILIALYLPCNIRRPEPQSLSNSTSTSAEASRTLARRALLLRLLAYIFIPLVTCLPMMVVQWLTLQGADSLDTPEMVAAGLCGLIGACNALVYWLDPTILAILSVLRRGTPPPAPREPTPDPTDATSSYRTFHSQEEYYMQDKQPRGSGDQMSGIMVMVQVTEEVDAVEEVARRIKDL